MYYDMHVYRCTCCIYYPARLFILQRKALRYWKKAFSNLLCHGEVSLIHVLLNKAHS